MKKQISCLCPECVGTGKDRKSYLCPKCKGSGIVEVKVFNV